jgi:hypothetical protein
MRGHPVIEKKKKKKNAEFQDCVGLKLLGRGCNINSQSLKNFIVHTKFTTTSEKLTKTIPLVVYSRIVYTTCLRNKYINFNW